MPLRAPALVSLFALCALAGGQARAQAGIGVLQDNATTGTVGSNKNDVGSGALRCPAGTILRGLYHRDRSMTGVSAATSGMTNQVGIYCGGIVTDGSTITVIPRNPDGSPDVLSRGYSAPGTERTDYCPSGQLAHQAGGWDREWSNGQYPPWASALELRCSTLTLDGADWVRMDTGPAALVEAGVRESVSGRPAHVRRGPFCALNDNTRVVSGLYTQAGGEGFDGVNIYCGRLQQARHSAVMGFVDFAWEQRLGTDGWRVDLTQSGRLLENGAGTTGADHTPHASPADNLDTMQYDQEIYVLPGNGYQAEVSGRPAGIADNTYVASGTCITGIALANEQDASCTLEINGLPDLGVSLTVPAQTYIRHGQTREMTISVTNYGPGATDGDDGFTLIATLPEGWSAGPLPPGCSADSANTVVTCAIDPTPLEAAASPGAAGGSTSFTLPLRVDAPTADGDYTVQLRLGREAPDGDADPTNDDYNPDNDSDSGQVRLQLATPLLTLRKISRRGAASFDFSGDNGVVAQTLTTTAADTPAQGPRLALAELATPTTITEAPTPGYSLSAIDCTGMAAGGTATVDLPNRRVLLDSAATDDGADIVCTFTNTRDPLADLSIAKTNTPGANGDVDQDDDTVTSGADTTYVLTITNHGPDEVEGAIVRDPPGERSGLRCTAPPTCEGAACPGSISLADLEGAGAVLGRLGVGESVRIGLTCAVL